MLRPTFGTFWGHPPSHTGGLIDMATSTSQRARRMSHTRLG
jgi:hypothetical protein